MDTEPAFLAQITKKRVFLVVLGIIVILVFRFIITTGFISVDVNSSGDTSYTITNQSNPGAAVTKKAGTHIKNTVGGGNYEVQVNQGAKSYFAVVKTRGFLHTTHVSATLSPEKNRSFVGDNPGSCMSLVNKVLLSISCKSTLYTLQEHVPATSDQPGYTQQNPNPLNSTATLEGIVHVAGGDYGLVKPVTGQGELISTTANYTLIKLNSDMTVAATIDLPALNRTDDYSVTPYQDGFLAYTQDFRKIYYYSSVDAQPTTVDITIPKDLKQAPSALSVYKQSIALAYVNDENGKDSLKNAPKIGTAVFVYRNKATTEYDFSPAYGTAILCSDSKLCLSNTNLEVFDIATNKAKQLFSVTNVHAMVDYGNNLLIIRKSGVYGLDVASQTGSLEYSFGSYSYCGIQQSPVGYILCVRGTDDVNTALSIDQSTDDSGSIDKKIATLNNVPEIESVSISNNIIYIVPHGQTVYDSTTQSYIPNPSTQKTNTSAINKAINKLGINRADYLITILTPL